MTQLNYFVGKTALGLCCIASTAKGICFLEFGSSSAELVSRLKEQFRDAELIPANSKEKVRMQRILQVVGTRTKVGDIKLDIQGTDFQKRVWKALCRIPLGATRTYSEIALAIGAPAAVRAVAKACASNKIGILIPCHRVIAKSGALAGYRWGVERKQKLLTGEQRQGFGKAGSNPKIAPRARLSR